MKTLSALNETFTDQSGASWNLLPQRAIPQNAAARNIGQDFAAALNAALEATGIEASVQDDGTVSLFSMEMLGRVAAVAPEVFPQAVDAQRLIADQSLQSEGLAEIIAEPSTMAEITRRLNFVASKSSGSKGSSKVGLVLPLVVAAGLGGIILLRRRK